MMSKMKMACVLFLTTALFANDDEIASGERIRGVIDPGVSLLQFDASAVTGSRFLRGVEFALDHFWVTAAGMQGDVSEPNYLFKIDRNGQLVDTFIQPTTSDNGWRDLAFDGTFLYGSDSDHIDQIDPTTGATTGVTIPTPLTVARGIAYSRSSDHFWVVDFGSTVYELNRSGAVQNSFNTAHTTYGLAWDPFTKGGPYLWTWNQDGRNEGFRLDPLTGNDTGFQFQGITPGIAGGASLSIELIPGSIVLVALEQDGNQDTVTAYDLSAGGNFVPTMSKYGMIALILLLLIGAMVVLRREKTFS